MPEIHCLCIIHAGVRFCRPNIFVLRCPCIAASQAGDYERLEKAWRSDALQAALPQSPAVAGQLTRDDSPDSGRFAAASPASELSPVASTSAASAAPVREQAASRRRATAALARAGAARQASPAAAPLAEPAKLQPPAPAAASPIATKAAVLGSLPQAPSLPGVSAEAALGGASVAARSAAGSARMRISGNSGRSGARRQQAARWGKQHVESRPSSTAAVGVRMPGTQAITSSNDVMRMFMKVRVCCGFLVNTVMAATLSLAAFDTIAM